jgi:Ala-tRNA(Pro) deacylase
MVQDSAHDIEALLYEQGIKFECYEHPPVFTTADVAGLSEPIPGIDTKNLFLRDEKKRQYVLVCLRAEVRVDLKALGRQLGLKGLTFGSAEDLWALLKVKPGAVCLFALINDRQKQVRAYLDNSISDDSLMQNHPLRNTKTIVLKVGDMRRFCAKVQHSLESIAVLERKV